MCLPTCSREEVAGFGAATAGRPHSEGPELTASTKAGIHPIPTQLNSAEGKRCGSVPARPDIVPGAWQRDADVSEEPKKRRLRIKRRLRSLVNLVAFVAIGLSALVAWSTVYSDIPAEPADGGGRTATPHQQRAAQPGEREHHHHHNSNNNNLKNNCDSGRITRSRQRRQLGHQEGRGTGRPCRTVAPSVPTRRRWTIDEERRWRHTSTPGTQG